MNVVQVQVLICMGLFMVEDIDFCVECFDE